MCRVTVKWIIVTKIGCPKAFFFFFFLNHLVNKYLLSMGAFLGLCRVTEGSSGWEIGVGEGLSG